MEPAGWILLLSAWMVLSSLVWFCLRRVLRDEPWPGAPPADREKPQDRAGAGTTTAGGEPP